jgi:threonine aldolase
MVQPGMVYISHPTETGTSYTKEELTALSEKCRELGIYLFLDGARLAYGLTASDNDLDLPTIAKLCDVFYIGGTKCGALMGEAVVINHDDLKKDFRYIIKQKGGMLAKGRLLGIQFIGLFENGLYEEVGRHAIRLADKLRHAIREIGIPLYNENTTNQIFIILEDDKIKALSKEFALGYTEHFDETHSVMRICTSWATKEENVDKLIAALR